MEGLEYNREPSDMIIIKITTIEENTPSSVIRE